MCQGRNAQRKAYNSDHEAQPKHPQWAWYSMFSVLVADIYMRFIAAGVIPDLMIPWG